MDSSISIRMNLLRCYRLDRCIPSGAGDAIACDSAFLSFLEKTGFDHPFRCISLFERIISSDTLPDAYAIAIVKGWIRYLHNGGCKILYHHSRVGSEAYSGYQKLSEVLTNGICRFEGIREQPDLAADLLVCCAPFIYSKNSIDILIRNFYRLTAMMDDGRIYATDQTGHGTSQQTSIQSKTARGAMILAWNLLKNDKPIPPLLTALLFRLCLDSNDTVRSAVVENLMLLAGLDESTAWTLFKAAFQNPPRTLWPYGEPFMICQVQHNFVMIRPYLKKMASESSAKPAETWGKLMAVACIFDHIDEYQLLDEFQRSANIDMAWAGAVEAFRERIECPCGKLIRIRETIRLLYKLSVIYDNMPENMEIQWVFDCLHALLKTAPSLSADVLQTWYGLADRSPENAMADRFKADVMTALQSIADATDFVNPLIGQGVLH